MMLASFVWHFDAELRYEGQPEPAFEDRFVVRKGSLETAISPVEREGKALVSKT